MIKYRQEWFAEEAKIRDALSKLNRQMEYLNSRYSEVRVCEQGLCTFCQNLQVFEEADCLANAPRWLDGTEPILHCGKFKQIPDWKQKMYQILVDALYQALGRR